MNKIALSRLGRIAAGFRRAGLQPLFTALRNVLDAGFLLVNFPPLMADVDGVRLHGFLRHRSFLEHLAKGTYESASRAVFRTLLPPADIFLDAGAHIGLYSMLASRHGNSGLVVVSFEPDPYNLRAFRWNLRLNRCRNVALVPAAVSDGAGSSRLLVSDGTIGSSLVLERTAIGDTHLLNVKTVSLDSYLKDYSPKSVLVKLDIEGAEMRALQGMGSALRTAARIAILCEVNPEALGAGGKTPADLVSRLRSSGLDVFFIAEEAGRLIPAEGSLEAKGNLLAVRNWPIDAGAWRA
jgi:FkbM family methyltransferase